MSPWLELACSLVLLIGLIPGWGAASWLERRAGGALEGETRLALAWALGLGWAQLGFTALGFLDLLRPAAVLGWLGLGLALGSLGLRGAPRPEPGASLPLLALAPILLLALVPPWYRDEMTYHLALPRQFALAGGYVSTDDNIFASFPLGWESALAGLSTLGEDGFSPLNPRLLGAWTAGFAALAIAGLGRVLGATPAIARAFAVVFLWMPTVLEFGPSAYVEPWLVLLAVLVVRLGLEARTSPGWGALAGALAGLAASVKYPGLVVGLSGLLLIPRGPRERFLVLVVLVGSPFYLRNLVERGNPFFPLAWELLGGEGWDAWRAYAYRATLKNYGEGREALDWILVLPRLFLGRDLVDGFEGSLGPLPLLGLLLAPFRRSVEPGARPARLLVLALALGWLLFWALTVQQARFALVPVALLLALGAASLGSGRWLPPVLLTLALAWGAGPLASLWTRQQTTAWLSGHLDREALLAKLLPESYVPLKELDNLVRPTERVWLVWTRGYTYYLNRPYRLDSVFEAWRLEALFDESPDLDAVHAALARDGITHLLIHHRFYLAGTNADLSPGRTARLRARFVSALEGGLLVPVRTWGPVTLYAVARPSPEVQR